jgi:hypothetical protein
MAKFVDFDDIKKIESGFKFGSISFESGKV